MCTAICRTMKILVLHSFLYIIISNGIHSGNSLSEVCPDIISKTGWGGRGARGIEYSILPLDYVIIHHTVTPACHTKLECVELLTNIQNFHMDYLHHEDIAYNFLVGGDGHIYEGRGWHKIGSHTRDYNSRSIAIAFLGTFTDKLPTKEQLKAAKDLIQCAEEKGELTRNYKLYGARQVSATQSPGLALYNEIQNWPHFSQRL